MTTPHLQRQDYRDIKLHQLDKTSYDICQLKYDGIWCAAVATHRTVEYYSRNGQLKRTDTNAIVPDGIYIGELMFGSEWAQDPTRKDKFYIFDCLKFNGRELKHLPYSDRMSQLQVAHSLVIHPNWESVPTFSSTETDNIWTLLVDTDHYEGLVFRKSSDPWSATILRAKKELTIDLVICGFDPGQGRLSSTLGALRCCRPDNPTQIITVGGGLSDSLRHAMWQNQKAYLGKVIRVTAKKVFASGLLRHPNFHSFHEDK